MAPDGTRKGASITDRKWYSDVVTIRKKLKEPTLRPWSSRNDKSLAGLRRQENQPNFLHELIDQRFIQHCQHRGLPYDSPEAPNGLWVDCRHEFGHQIKGGGICLLQNSLPYSYALDRVATHWEHFFHLGWDDDVNLSNIALPFPERFMEAKRLHTNGGDEQGAKKQRKCRKTVEAVSRAMSGSAQSLPDCFLISVCGLLSADIDIWTNPPTDIHFEGRVPTDPKANVIDLGTDGSLPEVLAAEVEQEVLRNLGFSTSGSSPCNIAGMD